MDGVTFRITSDHVPVEKFLSLVKEAIRDSSTGCWLWPHTQKDNGYGVKYPVLGWRYAGEKKQRYAHRLSYMVFRGEIPLGKEINHTCKNTLCVNPIHLQVASRRENLLFGETLASTNLVKTHCCHGHEFDSLNTRFDARGDRKCRMCDRLRRRVYVAAHRESVNAKKRHAYWNTIPNHN